MKKTKKLFIGMILAIIFCSCSSAVIKENRKNALELQASIEKVIKIDKTTEFEVFDLLGNPTTKVLQGDKMLRMAYYHGDFYHKNSESNKRILEKYIPVELLKNQETLEKVVLGIHLRKNNDSNERVVFKITGEVLRN